MRDGKVRPLRGLGKGLGPGPDRCEDEKKETMTPLPVPVEAAKGAFGRAKGAVWRPLAAWWVRSGGGQPGERAWTPDPYSRPNEGGGDPCQSDLGPQGIPGELTTGLSEGGGDPCQSELSDLAPRTLPGIARSGAGMGHPASL